MEPVIYIDDYGCITQSNGDAGDSCQRFGFMEFANFFLGKKSFFIQFLSNYFHEPAGSLIYWVRHPDATKWWGMRGAGGSRDQILPIIACFSFVPNKSFLLWKIVFPLLLRCGFFWNTRRIGQTTGWKVPDFITITTIGTIFRACNTPFFLPALLVTDFFLLIDVIFRMIVSLIDREDVGDDLNLQVMLVQASIFWPTLFSELSLMLYKRRCRAAIDGHPEEDINISTFGPQSALDVYFHPMFGGSQLNLVWKKIWERI